VRIGILVDHVKQERGGLAIVLQIEEQLRIEHTPVGHGRVHRRCFAKSRRQNPHPLFQIHQATVRLLQLTSLDPRGRKTQRQKGRAQCAHGMRPAHPRQGSLRKAPQEGNVRPEP
jgi:hypothetical protein